MKYKEKYEKSKGKSMLEFADTPTYQVSKEAQKFQSEVGGVLLEISLHVSIVLQ